MDADAPQPRCPFCGTAMQFKPPVPSFGAHFALQTFDCKGCQVILTVPPEPKFSKWLGTWDLAHRVDRARRSRPFGRMTVSDQLQQVLVDDLITYETWEKAPIGRLVQTKNGDASIIGMRCQLHPTSGTPMDRLLLLRGEQRGQLLHTLIDAPALDVLGRCSILSLRNPPVNPLQRLTGALPASSAKSMQAPACWS